MVLNWCPSNVKVLLIGTFGLTGVVQVSQWGQSDICPSLPDRTWDLVTGRSPGMAVCSLSCPSPHRLKALPARQKPPEIQGRDLAGPQLFSSVVHPPSYLTRLWKGLFQSKPGECVTRADMDPADPHLGLDLIHCAQAALGEMREA